MQAQDSTKCKRETLAVPCTCEEKFVFIHQGYAI